MLFAALQDASCALASVEWQAIPEVYRGNQELFE
jgi:hypothetical protein